MTETSALTRPSLWQIWSTLVADPRGTMRLILETDPHYLIVPLAMAHGIVRACGTAFKRNLADSVGLDELLAIIILGGSVAAVLGTWLFSWLLKATGTMLGGEATPAEIRAAMVWGGSPTVWELPVWGVQILLFGSALFSADKPAAEADGALGIAFALLQGVKLFLRWGAVYTSMKCLGEAFSFSAWRAFFASLLAGLVFFLMALPIAFVVVAMFR